ncbi:MAG: hypothetical protein NTY61_03135 [Candidatus Parcubacteria bacterium]|nr:hypothetical protein [Candidatus Parcubacteria bacterium]
MSRNSALNLTSELLDIIDGCVATTQDIEKRRQDRRGTGNPMSTEELATSGSQTFDAKYGAETTVRDQVSFIDQIARDLLHEKPRRGMDLSPTAEKIKDALSGKQKLEDVREMLTDLQRRL